MNIYLEYRKPAPKKVRNVHYSEYMAWGLMLLLFGWVFIRSGVF